jgi:uncharacterized protein (TIGR02271 family)
MNDADDTRALTRHEERLNIDKRGVDAGSVRARKSVTTEHVSTPTTRQSESYDHLERVPADKTDSGEIETLEDGSISIPILEEELVITKRLVVRERVILRKHVTLAHETIEADLRREQITIEMDDPHAV